jgi:hypothetical protein
MAEYYYLLAGLPDLKLESTDAAVSTRELHEMIDDQKEDVGRDMHLLELFFLKGDCKNLLILLEDNLAELPYGSNWAKKDLQEMIADALEDEFQDDTRFPSFMAPFVREYFERKGEAGYFPEDALMLRYWNYLKSKGTGFVGRWAALNLDIANTLTALICERQGWPVEQYTYGYDAADVDDDLFARLKEIDAETDPVQKERRIDALKWVWIEDETFIEPFNVDALYAYLLKAEMLERWAILDPEQGRERFTQIIEGLRKEATVPAEFTVYMPQTEEAFDMRSEGRYNKNEK